MPRNPIEDIYDEDYDEEGSIVGKEEDEMGCEDRAEEDEEDYGGCEPDEGVPEETDGDPDAGAEPELYEDEAAQEEDEDYQMEPSLEYDGGEGSETYHEGDWDAATASHFDIKSEAYSTALRHRSREASAEDDTGAGLGEFMVGVSGDEDDEEEDEGEDLDYEDGGYEGQETDHGGEEEEEVQGYDAPAPRRTRPAPASEETLGDLLTKIYSEDWRVVDSTKTEMEDRFEPDKDVAVATPRTCTLCYEIPRVMICCRRCRVNPFCFGCVARMYCARLPEGASPEPMPCPTCHSKETLNRFPHDFRFQGLMQQEINVAPFICKLCGMGRQTSEGGSGIPFGDKWKHLAYHCKVATPAEKGKSTALDVLEERMRRCMFMVEDLAYNTGRNRSGGGRPTGTSADGDDGTVPETGEDAGGTPDAPGASLSGADAEAARARSEAAEFSSAEHRATLLRAHDTMHTRIPRRTITKAMLDQRLKEMKRAQRSMTLMIRRARPSPEESGLQAALPARSMFIPIAPVDARGIPLPPAADGTPARPIPGVATTGTAPTGPVPTRSGRIWNTCQGGFSAEEAAPTFDQSQMDAQVEKMRLADAVNRMEAAYMQRILMENSSEAAQAPESFVVHGENPGGRGGRVGGGVPSRGSRGGRGRGASRG